MRLDAPIRVIVVDATGLRSSSLKPLLSNGRRSLELVGEAGDFSIASKLVAIAQPDVALVAADMAKKNERAFRKFANQGTSVLLLGDRRSDREDFAILRGASGIVYADDIAVSLFDAIKTVCDGHFWLNNQAAGAVFVALCRRETKIRHTAMRR